MRPIKDSRVKGCHVHLFYYFSRRVLVLCSRRATFDFLHFSIFLRLSHEFYFYRTISNYFFLMISIIFLRFPFFFLAISIIFEQFPYFADDFNYFPTNFRYYLITISSIIIFLRDPLFLYVRVPSFPDDFHYFRAFPIIISSRFP